jgi:hypothetical protein
VLPFAHADSNGMKIHDAGFLAPLLVRLAAKPVVSCWRHCWHVRRASQRLFPAWVE